MMQLVNIMQLGRLKMYVWRCKDVVVGGWGREGKTMLSNKPNLLLLTDIGEGSS